MPLQDQDELIIVAHELMILWEMGMGVGMVEPIDDFLSECPEFLYSHETS
jgi:hypothetical protein